MADIVIRLFSKYSHYKNFYLWEEDDGTLTVHDPNIGKQIGVAFPLPEGHGRLGDLDALKTGLFVFDEITRNYYINRKEIENAFTIVPAEGGGENGD